MDTQCNALYGTALYQRECLTTPKNSEGNRLLAAFLYRDIASFAVLRNRISLIINRFTPPHRYIHYPLKGQSRKQTRRKVFPYFTSSATRATTDCRSLPTNCHAKMVLPDIPFRMDFRIPKRGWGNLQGAATRVSYTTSNTLLPHILLVEITYTSITEKHLIHSTNA